ncbi:class I SAM-dependent methyltransferase [Oscillatoria sp. FACHB-1406]|uniref:class I SAM-dependent methyltransferase n=1 Tax=Oscillatoria sp. FACHB-1406 TaxID=2692846 RepID=UPI001684050B|nr:class I SAM-dependent methyltransferase [Oscillatoria sp. FACHB-1406]MBD2576280.1 class I SAM-dependent methyltransferase [Oscillatoria sp. FACHB-1406]
MVNYNQKTCQNNRFVKENFTPLFERLRERIAATSGQRITFAEYMDFVLYDPQYGYYSAGHVEIGRQGDFFTSASLGADFGELLAEQLAQMWEILDYPAPFAALEMGAGQGLLAADILRYWQQHYPELFERVEYIIVEQSPSLIASQQNLLQEWLDKGIKIRWQSWEEIADESLVGCCFSNELVDAFPVHRVTKIGGKLQEIYVTLFDAGLIEVVGELSSDRILDYFKAIDLDLTAPAYPEGYHTEVNLAALNWLETVAQKLKRGYLVTVDYGYTAQRYYQPTRSQGTLQCYFQHRHHNNPYVNLGQQDLTAHVDFTALERQGELRGLKTVGFTQQGLFLMALGLSDRLAELSSGKFNLQQILQRRDALHQLIDPSGLGGFGVLVQSKGLTELEAMKTLKGLSFPAYDN